MHSSCTLRSKIAAHFTSSDSELLVVHQWLGTRSFISGLGMFLCTRVWTEVQRGSGTSLSSPLPLPLLPPPLCHRRRAARGPNLALNHPLLTRWHVAIVCFPFNTTSNLVAFYDFAAKHMPWLTAGPVHLGEWAYANMFSNCTGSSEEWRRRCKAATGLSWTCKDYFGPVG